MELSITEWVIVQAMRGNGKTVNELLKNLGDDEKEQLINSLLHMPLRIKFILKKLGYNQMDMYQAEEDYFDKFSEFAEEVKKLLSGE